LHISTARISTYGVRAVDVFYVKNLTGGKIIEENKINLIKDKLMQAIHEKTDENIKALEEV